MRSSLDRDGAPNWRRSWTHLTYRCLLPASLLVGPLVASAQSNPYQLFERAPAAADPRSTPAAEMTDEDRAHRARIVARFDGIEIRVGEVEDRLALLDAAALARLQETPDGLRFFVREMMRGALLAREAERRGLASGRRVHAAQQDVLVELLRERDFDLQRFRGPAAASSEPERRRAVIVRARSRAGLQAFGPDEPHDYSYWLELASREPGARDTDWIDATDSTLPPSLRAIVFQAETNEARIVQFEGEWWLIIVLGKQGADTRLAEAVETQRAWEAREQAWQSLIAGLRDAHVQSVEPEALRGLTLPHSEDDDE